MNTPETKPTPAERYIAELRALAELQAHHPNPLQRQWSKVHSALADSLEHDRSLMVELPRSSATPTAAASPQVVSSGTPALSSKLDSTIEPAPPTFYVPPPHVAQLAEQLGASRVEPAPPTFYVPPIEKEGTVSTPYAVMVAHVTNRRVGADDVDVDLLVETTAVQRLEVTDGLRLWTFDQPTEVRGTITLPRGDESCDVELRLTGHREGAESIRQTLTVWVPRREEDGS